MALTTKKSEMFKVFLLNIFMQEAYFYAVSIMLTVSFGSDPLNLLFTWRSLLAVVQ